MELFENLKNKIDFYIRKKTRFSRQSYFEEPENLSNIFSGKLNFIFNTQVKKSMEVKKFSIPHHSSKE